MGFMMEQAEIMTPNLGFSANNMINSPNELSCLPIFPRESPMPILRMLSEGGCCWISTFAPMIALQAYLSWKRLQLITSSVMSSVMTSISVERGCVSTTNSYNNSFANSF